MISGDDGWEVIISGGRGTGDGGTETRVLSLGSDWLEHQLTTGVFSRLKHCFLFRVSLL